MEGFAMTAESALSAPGPDAGARTATGLAVVLERPDHPVSVRRFRVPPAAANEVVVAVTHAGVCGTDLHLQKGHLPITMPLVLGHEGLGVVHDLVPGTVRDADGNELAVGDRVMWASSISCDRCVPCRQYREPTLCVNRLTYGVNRPVADFPHVSGSWAEYIYLTEGTTIVSLPESVDSMLAMAFACAGPTVVHALLQLRPIIPEEMVVILGCGPVGLAAAAVAQLAGARRVIMIGHHGSRLRTAADAGIGDVHITVDAPDRWSDAFDEVRRHTMTGGGADVVVECASDPAAFAQGVELTRRGGSLVTVGQYTDNGDVRLNPHQIVRRQLHVIGSWGFSGQHVVDYVRLLPELSDRFEVGRLVTAFPLELARNAMSDVAERRVMKAVLLTDAAARAEDGRSRR
jgi:threonine dehydrogenase-like Zn-dependent dehydrogenase